MSDNTNAARQRRYIERLKQKATAAETVTNGEVERLRKQLAAATAEIAALKAVTNGAALDWQTRGVTHTARRGAWTYFIRRDTSKRFTVSISSGRSLPDKLVDMPSLELAKAHCAEHAAAHPVSDAAEITRLRARVAALEAQPKAAKPPLDPESAAASEIKGLKTRVRNLQSQLNHVKAGGNYVPFAVNALLAKALSEHPAPTDADRERALKALNAWKADSKAAGRR